VQEVPAVVFLKGPVRGAPAHPPRATPTMAQRDTAFVPAALVVQVGTTVDFPNGDPFFHNVFSYSSAARFDLGRYPRGETRQVTFDKPGIVKVYCEVHETMRAVIVVTENPFNDVVDAQGRFRIPGIPEGTYTMVIWHPDLDSLERQVRVVAGETVRLDVELR
jgi:plastocyanin